jgi:hypothetical protein
MLFQEDSESSEHHQQRTHHKPSSPSGEDHLLEHGEVLLWGDENDLDRDSDSDDDSIEEYSIDLETGCSTKCYYDDINYECSSNASKTTQDLTMNGEDDSFYQQEKEQAMFVNEKQNKPPRNSKFRLGIQNSVLLQYA